MLKGIDPRLDADTLHTLRAMGHGDMLILADTNFPAHALAPHTVLGAPLAMANLSAAAAAEAILSVMPLDTFVPDFAGRMEMVDTPDVIPDVQAEVQAVVNAAEGQPRPLPGIERFAFYDLSKQAYAIVSTGERRFYGCFMFRKGVIPPPDTP